jgi:HTH-type transcriptional regulator, sugar sensing transcriptional regulator
MTASPPTIEETLHRIGLSHNEIKVYLALNQNGPGPAGSIAKWASIDRSNCYDCLVSLTSKGIVSSSIIKHVTWFQVLDPIHLLHYLKEQQDDVKKILPQLSAVHKSAHPPGQVKYFRGISGIKSVFLDIAQTGKDNFVIGDEGQFITRMKTFQEQFDRIRSEKKFKTKLIINKRPKHLQPVESKFKYYDEFTESPAVTNIYGDKVAIIIWTDEPEAIIIENAAVAKSFKNYFDILWKYGKS